MTTHLQATSVTTQTEVQAPVEHAFRVFTEGIGSWWDPSHHILQAALAVFGGGAVLTAGAGALAGDLSLGRCHAVLFLSLAVLDNGSVQTV